MKLGGENKKGTNLCMMKIWLNVFSKQRENAIYKVIQRTRISNVIADFRKKTKMNTTNLIYQKYMSVLISYFETHK